MTQNERVIEYVKAHGSITQGEATKYLGVSRLAARIADLKKQGHAFTGTTVKDKNRFGETVRYARYKLT